MITIEINQEKIKVIIDQICDNSDFEHEWWLREKLENLAEHITTDLFDLLEIKETLKND